MKRALKFLKKSTNNTSKSSNVDEQEGVKQTYWPEMPEVEWEESQTGKRGSSELNLNGDESKEYEERTGAVVEIESVNVSPHSQSDSGDEGKDETGEQTREKEVQGSEGEWEVPTDQISFLFGQQKNRSCDTESCNSELNSEREESDKGKGKGKGKESQEDDATLPSRQDTSFPKSNYCNEERGLYSSDFPSYEKIEVDDKPLEKAGSTQPPKRKKFQFSVKKNRTTSAGNQWTNKTIPEQDQRNRSGSSSSCPTPSSSILCSDSSTPTGESFSNSGSLIYPSRDNSPSTSRENTPIPVEKSSVPVNLFSYSADRLFPPETHKTRAGSPLANSPTSFDGKRLKEASSSPYSGSPSRS